MRASVAALAGALILALWTAPLRSAPVEITFIVVSDLDSIDAGAERGGFARLATLIAAERERQPNLLFVHAGDAISPSLMSGYDQGAHVIELINLLQPDIFVPGNHEYDFGPEVFRQRMAEARVPLLAANLRDEDGLPLPGFDDWRLIDVDGVRIGLVGLTADDAVEDSSPGGLKITRAAETLAAAAAALRAEGADLVVAIAHANRQVDTMLVRGRHADMILSGDDHALTVFFDGRTVLAESKAQAELVVAVDLTVDVDAGAADGADGAESSPAWWPSFRVLDTAAYAPDGTVAARITAMQAELSAELDEPVAEIARELDSRRMTVRTGEAATGNLIADALRAITGAEIAIMNGGGIRGDRVYPAGTMLTRRDLHSELPFANRSVIIEPTGAQLLAALENGVSLVEDGAGRFPQVSGLTVTVDVARPAGQRIVSALHEGEPIEPDRVYRVATIDFIAAGGDGYEMFAPLAVEDSGRLLAEDVAAYLWRTRSAAPTIEGRIILK